MKRNIYRWYGMNCLKSEKEIYWLLIFINTLIDYWYICIGVAVRTSTDETNWNSYWKSNKIWTVAKLLTLPWLLIVLLHQLHQFCLRQRAMFEFDIVVRRLTLRSPNICVLLATGTFVQSLFFLLWLLSLKVLFINTRYLLNQFIQITVR